MQNFRPTFTRISGLSEKRRYPRLGIIRLGIKKQAKSGAEYPAETEYFVCPPEVQKIYGEKPTELDVMFPVSHIDSVFPQSLKWYGSTRGLKCHGDMLQALRWDDDKKNWQKRDCPCELLEQGKCKQTGILMFLLPKVSIGGVYQVRTSSYNSIVDINSGLDFVSQLTGGRFNMIKLQLKRELTETHHDGKKQTHYTLKLFYDGDLKDLQRIRLDTNYIHEDIYQLPAPIDENPELDPPDLIEEDEQVNGQVIDQEVSQVDDQVIDEAKQNDLIEILNELKRTDSRVYFGSKRLARIAKKPEDCSLEDLMSWVVNIEEFKKKGLK